MLQKISPGITHLGNGVLGLRFAVLDLIQMRQWGHKISGVKIGNIAKLGWCGGAPFQIKAVENSELSEEFYPINILDLDLLATALRIFISYFIYFSFLKYI